MYAIYKGKKASVSSISGGYPTVFCLVDEGSSALRVAPSSPGSSPPPASLAWDGAVELEQGHERAPSGFAYFSATVRKIKRSMDSGGVATAAEILHHVI